VVLIAGDGSVVRNGILHWSAVKAAGFICKETIYQWVNWLNDSVAVSEEGKGIKADKRNATRPHSVRSQDWLSVLYKNLTA